MKYIIIPLFRIVTLPIVVLFLLLSVLVLCIGAIYNWDFNTIKELFTDNSNFKGFWRSDLYRISDGHSGYYYKIFWHYIINKKSYGK